MTHGIYSDSFTEEEKASWGEIVGRLGTVDEEIHVIRVQLRRALVAQRKAEQDAQAALELAEVRQSDTEAGARIDRVSKRTDFHAIIDRLSGRLASLEKTRAELLAAAREGGEDPTGKAQEVATALRAMRALEQPTDDA